MPRPRLSSLEEGLATARFHLEASSAIRVAFENQDAIVPQLKLLTAWPSGLPRPNPTAWRLHEHCSTVTRAYALYERFVEELVIEWLGILAQAYPDYANLPTSLRDRHLDGTARLLKDLNKKRYSSITPSEALIGLWNGLHPASGTYSLHPAVFLYREGNLGRDVLVKLLTNVGLPNVQPWLDGHARLNDFLTTKRTEPASLEKALDEFLQFRNDAAHGVQVDEALSVQLLSETTEFIHELCSALDEFLEFSRYGLLKATGVYLPVARTIHYYVGPNATVLNGEGVALSVGDNLLFRNSERCVVAQILSMQLDGTPVTTLALDLSMEPGLVLNPTVREGFDVFVPLP